LTLVLKADTIVDCGL